MRRIWLLISLVLPVSLAWGLEGPVRIESGQPMRLASVERRATAAGPNDALLSYDSGPVYFFPDATAIGSYWGVRFTPAQACSLLSVSVFAFQGGGTVSFRFFTESAGQPGTEFSPPQVRTLIGDLSLETVPLTPVDVGATDFFVVMEIMTGPPPYPVTDADGGTGRSWFRYPGQAWEHVVDFDISMRANVRYYGPDNLGPEVVHIPVTLGFSESYSTEVRCGLNDPSGIAAGWVYYRRAAQPTFDSTVLTFQFDNEWSAELLPYPAGTEVEYFIRAWDKSTNHNPGSFPTDAPASLLRYSVHPGTEIAYDDGFAEMFFYLDTVWTGNAFAVRMTPQTYPCRVNLLRVYVTDTTSFNLEIRAPLGDSAGGLLAGPFTARASQPFTWVDFVIPEGSRPTLTSGDFFAIFRWRSATPESPAVGADSVAAAAARSYSYDGQFGWYKYTMFNWLIRAAVETPTGVVEIGGERPRTFALGQNFPNPFNPSTRIGFALTEPSHVTLTVFNLLGQQVRVLLDGPMQAGQYEADFDAHDARGRALPSGMYFYRLETARETQTRKMILMR